jgi:hypothetical protein
MTGLSVARAPEEIDSSPAFTRQVIAECAADFADVRLTVSGRCMEPALREGDVVTLVAPVRRRPRVGDVVLTSSSTGLRLHRLVWAPARGAWRTKADRARTWDPRTREADLIATAVEVRSGDDARGTRSAGRVTRSLLEVAIAYLRAVVHPHPAR